VRRLHQAHREIWAREVPGGITSAQFAVLNVLEQQPGIDQRMLGELVGIDRSTIAEMVRRLTARRLLTRFRDTGDGRRNLLRLTGEGATALRQAVPAVRRVSEQLVRVLGDRDRAELVRLLNLVTESHAPHP
jgi:DNA-binding MarR family transcriptional regulator